jgi:hypothetical protein
MPYGILKADTITYYTATGDVSVAVSGIAIQGASVISGVSGIFTTSVSGATVTGNAGQFTTITGGTAQFTSVTGVSGVFTTRISGATVTGDTGQFTTLTAVSGVFTTNISGATISGDAGLFGTISGGLGVFSNVLSVPSGTAGSPSVSFNGDPNTGLYSPGADQVAISTNGTQRILAGSGGNVGIGPSTSLGARIDANTTGTDSCVIRARNDSTSVYLDANNGYTYLNCFSNHPLLFGTNNTERMRLDSSGRLGLGTSAPQSAIGFPIGTTTWISQVAGTSHSASNIGSLGIGIYDGSAFSGVTVNNTHDGTYSSQDIRFSTAEGGVSQTTERMRITPAGRVGIGSNSPGAKLHISDSFASAGTKDYLRLQSESAIDSTVMRIGGFAYTGNARSAIDFIQNGGTGFQSQIVFSTSSGGDATERGRWDQQGRFLVGTSSARQNYYNLTSFGGSLQIEGTSGGGGRMINLTNNSTGNDAPLFVFAKSDGASVGSNTLVSSGTGLGEISFQGSDGAEFVQAAAIQAFVDGTPGTNDMPGRLVFSTTADGASSPTERVRISQNGVVTVKNGAVAEIGTLTDGATITPDFAANCNFTLTISGSRTLANPTNITAGQTGSIFIIQGSGSNTLSWGSYWDFTGGTAPTLSTASGAVDRVDYVVRTSTSIHTVFTANYS